MKCEIKGRNKNGEIGKAKMSKRANVKQKLKLREKGKINK